MFLQEKILSSFRQSILISLFKKWDANQPSNYRGLSLIDTLCKVFNTILLNRITEWTENYNVLNECQAGFRKNYSTVGNIFNLLNIVNLNKWNGNNTFDIIPRKSLYYKLSYMVLSTKIIRNMKTAKAVFGTKVLLLTFFCRAWSKTRLLLRPLLFSLYVNELAEELPHGVNVAGTNAKILFNANDIVILSDSQTKLKQTFDALFDYCTARCLKANMNKSKIVIFRSGTRISWN